MGQRPAIAPVLLPSGHPGTKLCKLHALKSCFIASSLCPAPEGQPSTDSYNGSCPCPTTAPAQSPIRPTAHLLHTTVWPDALSTSSSSALLPQCWLGCSQFLRIQVNVTCSVVGDCRLHATHSRLKGHYVLSSVTPRPFPASSTRPRAPRVQSPCEFTFVSSTDVAPILCRGQQS